MRPRVVIVGAGFAGLATVRALKKAPVDVVVVDQNNYHSFSPFQYQVASAELDAGEVAHPVRDVLRHIPNADFRLARVEAIDLAHHFLATSAGPIGYDYAVLAPGSVDNFFDVPGAQEQSYSIKTVANALALRNRVLECFEKASVCPDPEERRLLMSFAIAGGGPTGVEYAGALIDLIQHSLARDFKNLDIGQARVFLVDGVDHLLGPFAPSLQLAARNRLESWGVDVILGSAVTKVSDSGMDLLDGTHISAGTVIWAAGVKASQLGSTLGMDLARSERVRVLPTLQIDGHPEVFVAGDLAQYQDLPMLAPVAIQEGRHAASNIKRLVTGHDAQPFSYHDKGIMATIGRNNAIAQIGPLKLRGIVGWVAWAFVHIAYIISHRSKVVVLVNWASAYLFRNRPLRLITNPSRSSEAGPPEGLGNERGV